MNEITRLRETLPADGPLIRADRVLLRLSLSADIYQLDGELTVGRSPGCGIPTSYDVYSSTIHSRLFRSGNQLWVEDLGSTNGTYVNSERIARATRLVKGDLVQIGATVFEVSR